jgi:succinylglutamic semialdehyde dehydrogenase
MNVSDLSGKHYIDGCWVAGNGDSFISTNPVNNAVIWHGNNGVQDDTVAAFSAAKAALSTWRMLSFDVRANHVLNFTAIVKNRQHELMHLISTENGKPLWESATEVANVIGKAALAIQAHKERLAERKTINSDTTSCLRFKPQGVVAVLGAFNFPAHLSNGHIIPALLAGNTVVYKPSELTPAVAEFIIQCWHDSGLPAGVINCIQGDASTAKHLLNNPIQGVFFTGSYHAGRQINQQLSSRPEVIITLEMGGNNPLVIDEIADIKAAVYQTILSSFMTSGQRCTCARRLMIPNTAKGDEFLLALLEASKQLRVGSYDSEPEPFMGPVITQHHALAHLAAQDELKKLGGVSLLTMTLLKENTALLSPGIMDMTGIAFVPDEEIFAPFAQIYRYHDFEEALMLANQTRYGLSASLFSDNSERYDRFYQTINAGLINWNKPTTGAASDLPFGGVGRSGNHRPTAYFATDYCAYPIASQEQPILTLPTTGLPGII